MLLFIAIKVKYVVNVGPVYETAFYDLPTIQWLRLMVACLRISLGGLAES